MEKRAQVILMVLVGGVVLAAVGLFRSKPPTFHRLTIAYTNEIRGEIEPCG